MNEDIAEEEALLFLLLRRRCREQKRNKERTKPTFWVRDIFCERKQYGEYSRGTENWRSRILFRCVYILFILSCAYFSFLPISCREVISLKLFCNILVHFINVGHNDEC